MFGFLGALGLQPVEWDQAVQLTGKGSPYVGEILDAAFAHAQAIVVLLTPDDIAYLKREFAAGETDPETDPKGQARPNVLFEAGMALGRNPDRTILVELGELRPFSDVVGRHAVRMNDSAERRKSLAQRLHTAGCAVDTSGDHWLRAGAFTEPGADESVLPRGKRLPTGKSRGAAVDAHWYGGSGSRMDQLKIVNVGTVPILDLEVEIPQELEQHVRLHSTNSVSKLPVGKSLTIRAWTTGRTMGPKGPQQFNLVVRGRLEDGRPFEQEIYLDTVG